MSTQKMKRLDYFSQELTAELKREKAALVEAYGEFWHSVGFVRGWATPAFHYVDVKDQLEDAADMVVRIRSYCLSKHPDMRTHPIGGAAVEFLWSLHSKPTHADMFVNDVVHATFTDAKGYVAPLDESLVNRYIDEIRRARAEQAAKAASTPDLKAEFEATQLLLEEVLPELVKDGESRNTIVQKLRDLNLALEAVALRTKEVAAAHAAKQRDEAAAAAADVAPEDDPPVENDPPASDPPASDPPAAVPASDPQSESSESESEGSASSEERRRMKASIDRFAHDEKKLIQIQKIAADTSSIEKDVKEFEQTDLKRLEELGSQMDPKERHGMLDRLQKRALMYAHKLEQELTALDSLEADDNIRPLRREQVKKIQDALTHVDRLQHKLKDLHEDHLRTEEAVKSPSPPPASASSPPPSSPPEPAREPDLKKSKDKPDEGKKSLVERFASLKLDPRFAVKDLRDRYVISAYVPGVDEDTLKIALNEDGDILTCAGKRIPSEEDIASMKQELRVRLASNPRFRQYQGADEDELLLRFSVGRFGSFAEQWRVDPRTVNAEAIQASYQNGVIEIVVPKIIVKEQPRMARVPPGYGGGYPGYRQAPQFFW